MPGGGAGFYLCKSVHAQEPEKSQMSTGTCKWAHMVIRVHHELSFLIVSLSQWNRTSAGSGNGGGGVGSLEREKKCFSYLEHR